MSGGPLELTLLGTRDCHLCHVMEEVVAPVAARHGARLVVRDIRDDRELLRRYRNDIPVLLCGDTELARHRVDAGTLEARLTGLRG